MNWVLFGFAALVLLRWAASLALERMNIRHASGHLLDPRFEGFGRSEADKQKTLAYTLAKSRHNTLADTFETGLILAAALSGLLPWFHGVIEASLGVSAWAQAAFLFGLGLAASAAGWPLAWIRQFRLEERFGFNTSTQATWWKDRILGIALSLALLHPLLTLIIYFIEQTGALWWLWAWAAVALFQLVLVLLAPKLILPLFNKFEPLPEGPLRERIEETARRAGVVFTSIQSMDGSKRSRHSNAFLTGLGRYKKIALFDTLIEQLSPDELQAVTAHELGHHVKGHIPKRLAVGLLVLLLELLAAAWLIRQDWLVQGFGFEAGSAAAGLLVAALIAPPVLFWLSPVENRLSRKHEYEADRYAAQLMNTAGPMIAALVKLETANLGNPAPHPLYSAFHYSHPATAERVKALREIPLERE